HLLLSDRDRAALPGLLELNGSFGGREDRVVAAQAGALARPEAGAALADDDLAAGHALPGEDLDPEHLGIGFAAVATGAEPFLMRHFFSLSLSVWLFSPPVFS